MPNDIFISRLSVYKATLKAWAARTRSEPTPSWRGPGTYRFGGFMTDENRPVAVLERI